MTKTIIDAPRAASSFLVWCVWARCHDGSYDNDCTVVDAFETKAQAYARKARLEKMLDAANRRIKRWSDGGCEGPLPVPQGAAKHIIARFGDRAVLYVASVTVKRGAA